MIEPGLDAAWREVEAALPEGWAVFDLTKYGYDEDCQMEWPDEQWSAKAGVYQIKAGFGASAFDYQRAQGPTPAAALLALAAALRTPKPEGER